MCSLSNNFTENVAIDDSFLNAAQSLGRNINLDTHVYVPTSFVVCAYYSALRYNKNKLEYNEIILHHCCRSV